ncbi:hypothetical protein ABFS83_03G028300 [Erythranthe nasuta]
MEREVYYVKNMKTQFHYFVSSLTFVFCIFAKGPCQPHNHDFHPTIFGNQNRRFNKVWFSGHSNWLEYNVSKDAAYYLCCYLFKPDIGGQSGGKCQDLMNQKQHIETVVCKQSNQKKARYKIRLNTSIEVARYLSTQGLAFRGHGESESSNNPGNFIQLVKNFGRINPDIKALILNNAPLNQKMTSPDIQKEIVNAFAMDIMNVIISDLCDSPFCLMVDEARDISMKEQMALLIRYVDKCGSVIERFLGVEHVTDTSALTLKANIDNVFSRYGLSISKLRGQGYDGASNMRGQFNGLKTLIFNENPSAYYIHCFARQLQLALVAVARKHDHISSLFDFTTRVLNKQSKEILEALDLGEISTGRGLNQETNLKRAGDTRWSSHYNTLLSLINMFGAVIDVLELIGGDASSTSHRTESQDIVDRLLSFDVLLSLFLMKKVLAITNELSQALQRKDQDIVNAMTLVQVSKIQIQSLRESGWSSLLDGVTTFCEKHGVDIPQMDAKYVARGRRRRNEEEMTKLHYYKIETFYIVLDMQLGELNARFSDSTMELLMCFSCLDASNSFSHYNKEKLLRLVDFYPKDFTELDKCKLSDQLDNYIVDMRLSKDFFGLNGITDLARIMVETRRNKVYPLVYMLLTLALTLLVATATVERAFSAMNIIKNGLRNRMNDEWLSDSLLVFIEREVST